MHEGIEEKHSKNALRFFLTLGVAVQSSVNIVILQSIRIKEPSDEPIEVEPEQELKLVCDAMIDERIQDTISFNWYKDEEKLDIGGPELLIDRVGRNDGGIYKCSVTSSLRILVPVESSWTVQIIQSPKILSTFPHSLILLKGQTRHLNCSVKGLPTPNVEWKFEDDSTNEIFPRKVVKDITDQDVGQEIFVDKPGVYTCEATNDHGASKLSIEVIFVDITTLPSDFINGTTIEADAGTSIKLNCSVTLDDQLAPYGVTRRWFKDGTQLSETGEFLSVPYLVDREHSGSYACEVATKADNITVAQNLKVITEEPKLKPVSKASFLKSTGSNATFECLVQAGM